MEREKIGKNVLFSVNLPAKACGERGGPFNVANTVPQGGRISKTSAPRTFFTVGNSTAYLEPAVLGVEFCHRFSMFDVASANSGKRLLAGCFFLPPRRSAEFQFRR